jgi:DNA-directed RNA polymerase specialized sigma24 family protein
MNSVLRDDVTRWLRGWSKGDETALERLTPLVYGELHHRARGGVALAVAFDETVMGLEETLDLVHLDDALHARADTDARTSRVVELRFFGGFSVDEVAAILEVSPQTVLRDGRLAKAWLRREMKRGSRARR